MNQENETIIPRQIVTIDLKSPLFAGINITVPCKCCHDMPEGIDLPINRESLNSAHVLHGLVQSALIEALKKSSIPDLPGHVLEASEEASH